MSMSTNRVSMNRVSMNRVSMKPREHEPREHEPREHEPEHDRGAHLVVERGAAVFVVVSVITLLTSVGLFAVRNSTLSNKASGYNRQLMQTHYVTDLAVVTTVSRISRTRCTMRTTCSRESASADRGSTM